MTNDVLVTDPARELADICERLSLNNSATRGDEYLAKELGVEPWTRDFFLIIFCIIERIDFLIELIDQTPIDGDYKQEIIGNVRTIQSAFDQNSLSNRWDKYGCIRLASGNILALKMLSSHIRDLVSYPVVSQETLSEVIALIDELRTWLINHQLKEQDFIRQAIVEGLNQLEFRLERLGWLGWGYALESLREVISAYFALQQASNGINETPQVEAILKKTGIFVKSFYEKTKLVKDVTETSDFMLRAYGAVALLGHGTKGIAGFLTFAGAQ